MSELDDLRRENASLRQRNAELLEQVADARQAMEAVAGGEVDAVAVATATTPVLLLSAQEELRRSQRLFRGVFDGSLDAMILSDDEGVYVDANPAAAALLGLPKDQLLGRRVGGFTTPGHDAVAVYQTLLERGRSRGQFSLQRADGMRAIEFTAAANVAPGLHLWVFRDATDRTAAEAALRLSEERYRRIVEGTSEGIWMYDAHGTTTFMNARLAEMLGTTVDEAVGRPLLDFVDASDRVDALARMQRRRSGVSERFNCRFWRRDGAEVRASVQANALFDAAGQFEAGLLLLTDLSTERRADETRAHLAAIVESSEDAILGVSPDGLITSWNASAAALYQYSAAEIAGKPVSLLIPPAILDEERRILERVLGGHPASAYETVRRRKDGSSVEVAVTISPVRNTDGAVIGISKIARDLTARRKADAAHRQTEEQLRQAQKMEAVGRLAGGVAHDFNNLLTVILSYAHLALEGLMAGDPLRDDMEQIQKAGRRATELTGQLLAFSRQQVLQPRVIDVNEVVQGMKRMLGRLLGEDVDLTLAMGKNLGRVVADPSQIEQVVMNLAVNARDAMPDGGKLTIETAAVELDASYASAHHGVAPGAYVLIAVNDTGKGMDGATRARIFEPFFTTKEKGKGTGLGLATVFGIVQQSGGHVGVYSEPDKGSVFKVYLPRTDRTVDAPRLSMAPGSLRGSETILLVEDEEQVRTVATTILRRSGYHVLETANGGEAFLVAKDFPSRIDLLFTDVVMPRVNGRKLADELASARPEMRVLFASGYTDDAIVHHGVLEAGVEFIQKPFTGEALLKRVREVLDTPDEERRAAR